jgi:ferritin-like protein
MTYHEADLSDAVRDLSRALISLKEEIEAIDWYTQRVEACSDTALRDVLAHSRGEEIEHAAMTLEWLRRSMPGWDEALRTYLFTSAPITELEAIAEKAQATAAEPATVAPLTGTPRAAGDLGIGSLRSRS